MNMPYSEHPLAWIDDELAALDAHSLRRYPAAHCGPQGAEIEIRGRRYLNFGSNDYLGLAADPRLAAAVRESLDRDGLGSAASPLLAGRSAAQARLEAELAEFESAEAALVFSSGFAANLAVIPALVGRGDAIFADEMNHASLIDGCRLSRAAIQVYPHGDSSQLARLLVENRGASRRLIVTDTLFSMDGDLAPLRGTNESRRATSRHADGRRSCTPPVYSASGAAAWRNNWASLSGSTFTSARSARRSAAWEASFAGGGRSSTG